VHRIAAVGGVDHGELVGVLAQHRGDALEQPRALERRRVAPAVERLLGRLYGGIDVVGAAVGDRAERFAGAGIDGVDVVAGLRLVPGAAIKGIAMLRQMQRFRLGGFDRGGGVNGPFLAFSTLGAPVWRTTLAHQFLAHQLLARVIAAVMVAV
jgi:hypothetical protein